MKRFGVNLIIYTPDATSPQYQRHQILISLFCHKLGRLYFHSFFIVNKHVDNHLTVLRVLMRENVFAACQHIHTNILSMSKGSLTSFYYKGGAKTMKLNLCIELISDISWTSKISCKSKQEYSTFTATICAVDLSIRVQVYIWIYSCVIHFCPWIYEGIRLRF